ncbi:hypothetical protein CEUSTIGMA_g174.t1 [Chlamydomonas eustigma]|uniref:Uncharacterized protein n=1 Tax=Chlamydomonas eustigma TaxID=1157962 RepID=A0A250WPG0_9CHLO|nr:hypothetical protein CEUSTIGMA_g174.t1 [Chlamydomonas eustigma]|eukprot:GAX72718.1 hypothetical protein CEUSTIGMA_g174.t1 [Chlamydomonas eustigma]
MTVSQQMPKSGLSSTDVMHYESRALRDQLRLSAARLTAARAQTPLTDQVESNGKEGHPQYVEMNSALNSFETSPDYLCAPAREKAFYSALRTLLGDISSVVDNQDRGVKLTAAYKWFSKHRPRGLTEDPAIFAAMATSLSLEGSHHSPKEKCASLIGFKDFDPQGTKHEFFASYSKEPPKSVPHATVPSTSPPGLQLMLSGGGSSGGGAPSASSPARAIMSVVMHPAVPRPLNLPSRVGLPQENGHRFNNLEAGWDTLKDAGATVPGPAKGKAFLNAGNALQGGSTHGAGSAPAISMDISSSREETTLRAAEALVKRREKLSGPELAELIALSQKWSAMDLHASRTTTNVELRVRKWSMQRARLEEEIVRRQEASRFASPSLHAASGEAVAALKQVDGGYLSPYATLISDQHGMESDTAITKMPGLMLPPSISSSARAVRNQSVENYTHEMLTILRRINELGIDSLVPVQSLDKALSPVPDKAYLQCLSKLPYPGKYLVSRPASSKKSRTRTGSPSKRKSPLKLH